MIPIPQSPWTLAIAELIGMRLAALGSSAHPADLLANFLPSGESPPEGWFDRFVAGTPIPGWSPSATSASFANVPGVDVQDAPTNAAALVQPGSSPQPMASVVRPQAGKKAMEQRFADLWEATLKYMTITGRAEGEIPASPPNGPQTAAGMFAISSNGEVAELPPAAAPPAGMPSPQLAAGSVGNTPRFASSPTVLPGLAGEGPSSLPSPGRQIGQDRRVEVNLTVDARQFGQEMRKVAKTVAEQTFGRMQTNYAMQSKGSGGWRR